MYVIGNSYHIHKGASISDVLIQIRLCLLNLKDFTSSVHHCSPEYRPNPVLLPESLLRLPLRRYAAAFRKMKACIISPGFFFRYHIRYVASLTSLLFAVNKFIAGIFTWIFVLLHKCVLKT